MLTQTKVQQAVESEINALLEELGDELDNPLTAETELHELGLNSLMLARLLIQLDSMIGVENPFAQDEALADVRSIGDIVAVYGRALAKS
jgi:acyl carrier protein